MASKAFAVIAGVGPGTGAACARRFASAYPVALLARNPENYESLVQEINKSGGKAIGISTDVSKEDSVKAAFKKIEEEYSGATCAAAIFNASGPFARKPLLEMSVESFAKSWEVSVQGALIFSQASLPHLLKHAEDSTAKYPPTLIFTGATASVKANAQMSGFAAPKFALRALSTSIAKEFAPKGVHVAHAVIDGVIDIPRTKDWLKDMPAEAKIGADDIAESYWNLHLQSKRCFTNEIDIRPMLEKW
ncbi:hypothetical protein LTR37_012128 [Vermiconidia calcicola]|uniref:Uncharacterized protein n=1 Tax=Vermiconidia calcicola TaxID=1690605 RepID=A0ACC3N058_9PEZI|nr:hypothetical protein LTR37_012128 [Vermiconidia calcicola]